MYLLFNQLNQPLTNLNFKGWSLSKSIKIKCPELLTNLTNPFLIKGKKNIVYKDRWRVIKYTGRL